jgi:hypothetical protein
MPPRRSGRAPLLSGNGPLARVPPVVAFLVVLVVFALGVWIRGTIGAALLAVLCIGVLILLAGTWRVLRPVDRAMRVLVVAILAMVALSLLH